MKTLHLKRSLACLMVKCRLLLTAVIALFLFNINTPVSAQPVLFDFDNAPIYTSLPITLTQGGITAHFSAGYYGYSIQSAGVLGFIPQGFGGRCIYPNTINAADLYISFDQTLTYFSIMYSCQELGCDDAATMRVTAYMNGSYIGTNTKTASHPGTWPVDVLSGSFPQGFDSVVVHYDSHPPTCQDYGVIFMADNMQVTALGCIPPTATQAAINASGSTTFCKGSSTVLSVATAGLTYQWKKGNNNVSGATLQSYTANKTGTYKCVVSNGCGSITSNAIPVTVNPTPTITVSQDPCSLGAVVLHASSNPASGVTYMWKKGSKILSGATNSTYTAVQAGTYKCIATITATGCSKTSGGSIVSITCKQENGDQEKDVIVYPNPTSDYFHINVAQPDPQSMIYIYDLAGRLCESHTVAGGEIQVGGLLPNGVYFLKIVSGNETKQIIKLVKSF